MNSLTDRGFDDRLVRAGLRSAFPDTPNIEVKASMLPEEIQRKISDIVEECVYDDYEKIPEKLWQIQKIYTEHLCSEELSRSYNENFKKVSILQKEAKEIGCRFSGEVRDILSKIDIWNEISKSSDIIYSQSFLRNLVRRMKTELQEYSIHEKIE